MICQECNNKPATLHFTKIINGEKTEIHLCEDCAKEKSELLPGTANGFSIHNLLSGWLDFEPNQSKSMGSSQSTAKTMRCEKCGLTYSQFGKLGKFGCSACYKTFASRLEPVFKRVHGNSEHVGKVPKRTGGRVEYKRTLDKLKRQMQYAIEQEEFEEAAALRDRIREMESNMTESG